MSRLRHPLTTPHEKQDLQKWQGRQVNSRAMMLEDMYLLIRGVTVGTSGEGEYLPVDLV